jgi:hypothetical protein
MSHTMSQHRPVGTSILYLVIALSTAVHACDHNRLYCDETHPCHDPNRPYCDLEGVSQESGGHGRTCVSTPLDAGGQDALSTDAPVSHAIHDAAVPDTLAVDTALVDAALSSHDLVVDTAGSGRGTIVSSPMGLSCPLTCSARFDIPTQVSLIAVPSTGSRFDGFTGDCMSSTCRLVMDADKSVTATFVDVHTWTTVAGESGDDKVAGVAYDVDGQKIFLVGSFSGKIDLGCGPLVSDGPKTDVFVASFAPDGSCTWSRRFGGPGTDTASGVGGDGNHNVVFAGSFEGRIDFGGTPIEALGETDAFLVHLSGGNGAHFRSRGIGGVGHDEALGLAVYGLDHLIVGKFNAAIDFGDGKDTHPAGSSDAFVAKYEGLMQAYAWSRTYGGEFEDRAIAVAADPDGNALVTGSFRGKVTFGGDMLSAAGGSADIFVLKLDSAGAHTWVKRFGGANHDEGFAILGDSSGNVLVGGTFASTIAFGINPFVPMLADGFVVKLSVLGEHVWSRQLGGPGADQVRALAVGRDAVYALGTYEGTVDFGYGPQTSSGLGDGFVVALARDDGAHTWSNGIGGSGNDMCLVGATNGAGHVVVGGSFQGEVDFGGGNKTSAGEADGFLVQYAP